MPTEREPKSAEIETQRGSRTSTAPSSEASADTLDTGEIDARAELIRENLSVTVFAGSKYEGD